jgi:signal peptidase I
MPKYNTNTVPIDLSSSEVTSLFEDILNRGLSLRTRVTGASMTPFLKGGEILTIRKVRFSSLRIGDLIFFKGRRGYLVLHRIIRRSWLNGCLNFHTKGDGTSALDEPVDEDHVLGKVSRIERIVPHGKTKHIDMESRLRKEINYLIAIVSIIRAKVYSAVFG